MKNQIKNVILFPVCAVILLSVSCNNTPFAPVAVPSGTAIRPVEKIYSGEKLVKELESLHLLPEEPYRIMPGDVFSFSVPGRDDLGRNAVTVLSDGAISVAPVGYLKISGLTIPEASELLSKKFRKYIRDCEIILEPVTVRQASITISGAVGKPGIYPILHGTTKISDAIALAGGLLSTTTDEDEPLLLSNLQNACIVRNGKILPADFSEALFKGSLLHNIPVMNGDYIFIPSLENSRIAVLGEVRVPDNIVYQPDLTLLQAIAKAGGLRETNSRIIKVIRGGLQNPVVYHLDIRKIQHGELMDFALTPSDIVFVPRDALTEWNVIAREIMVSLQLLNGAAGPFGNTAILYK